MLLVSFRFSPAASANGGGGGGGGRQRCYPLFSCSLLRFLAAVLEGAVLFHSSSIPMFPASSWGARVPLLCLCRRQTCRCGTDCVQHVMRMANMSQPNRFAPPLLIDQNTHMIIKPRAPPFCT